MRGLINKMKILLPHLTVNLDSSLNFAQRKQVIEHLLIEEIEFLAQTMTLEEYLLFTWEKQKTKVILDMFAYYLTKEEKNLEVLSHKKVKEISKGSERYSNFSCLSEEDKEQLGITINSSED